MSCLSEMETNLLLREEASYSSTSKYGRAVQTSVSALDHTDDTFHAFHLKEEEKICETLMTLRGMLCSENVMRK